MAYNTTPFHGKVCRVEKNDVAVDFNEGWTINSSLDMADISRTGQNWKEGLPGQAQWSGNFICHTVLGNTEQKALVDNIITASPGTKLTDMKFLLDASTNAFTGNIYIIGLNFNSQIGDKAFFTVNFQGDAALSITDAA